MTSTTIYNHIAPTYLYIKRHLVTGLLYFGKTTRDPYLYNGSGKYWTIHYKKHGKEHIETIWVSEPYTDTSIIEHALHFSAENNIVESNEWANLKPENGLDGGTLKGTRSVETRAKISASKIGKPLSAEHIASMSASQTGKTRSAETKAKMSASHTGKVKTAEHRANLSAANTGKTLSAESIAKRTATRRANKNQSY